jgi:Family of unknown function (DUF6335)
MAKKRAARQGSTARKRTGAGKRAGGRAAQARSKARVKRAKRPSAPRRAARHAAPKASKVAKKAKKPAGKSRRIAKKAAPRAVKQATPPAVPRPPRENRPVRLRHAPSLDRSRRHLPELEDNIPTPPSSLDLDRTASAARSGRQEMREARLQHNETSPELTGGDVDANWEDAYSVGDEAPGGDNPTPDQDRVDDIGRALGVEYQDNEELKAADKISNRDRHRWELDPASAEDYRDRD